jgi:hypothetical protein
VFSMWPVARACLPATIVSTPSSANKEG